MRPRTGLLLLAAVGVVLAAFSSLGAANPVTWIEGRTGATLGPSGAVELRDVTLGSSLTECPQAGMIDRDPKPLDRRVEGRRREEVERRRRPPREPGLLLLPAGRDVDRDQPGSTAEPRRRARTTTGWAGARRASTPRPTTASSWYDGIIPFPSLPNGDNLDGGGDPAIAYDRGGHRLLRARSTSTAPTTRTASSSAVRRTAASRGRGRASRSTTCDPTDESRLRRPRRPAPAGRRHVTFSQDNDRRLRERQRRLTFNDKEWITAGPRPAGCRADCFTPVTKTPRGVRSRLSIGAGPALRHLVAFTTRPASRRSIAQLLGRSGPFLVAAEGDQRQRAVLRPRRRRTRATTTSSRCRR